jgi:hypothetical protein
MERMSGSDRLAWAEGSRKDHERLSKAAVGGQFRCDNCNDAAITIGHAGQGTPIVLRCRSCYLRTLEEMRRNRPTRDELIARVNAAIA